MTAVERESRAAARPLPGFPDLEIVDLRAERSPRNEALLKRFYEGIYRAAFPIVSEQESPAIWVPKLWPTGEGVRMSPDGPQTASGTVELHCLLVGQRLAAATGEIHGGVIVEYFPDSLCGLITYLAVDPDRRGRGLGRALVGAAIETLREKNPWTAGRAAEQVRDVCNAAVAAHGQVLRARSGLAQVRARLTELDDGAPPEERARLMAELARRELELIELVDERAWLRSERSRLDWLEEQHGLAAVFAEMNDPRRIGDEAMDGWSRMAVFERLGGRIVGRRAGPGSPRILPLPYTQPELAPGQGRNDELLLLALPLGGFASDTVSRHAVKWFLSVFYRSLADKDRAIVPRNLGRDPDLTRTLTRLREPHAPLLTLRPERPSLSIDRFSLALHLVHPAGEDGAESRRRAAAPNGSSPAFASFERDILSYAYRDERQPLWSLVDQTGPLGGYPVTVHLPAQTSFASEGQSTLLWCAGQDADAGAAGWPADADPPPGGRSLNLHLLVSRTCFRSGIDVFHLALVGDGARSQGRGPSGSFNEYDLIKLVKLCEGGEYSDVDSTVSFAVRVRHERHHACAGQGRASCAVLADETDPEADLQRLDFAELAHAAVQRVFPHTFAPLGPARARTYRARAATIQIQTGRPVPAEWQDVFGCIARLAARETALEELHGLLGVEDPSRQPPLGRHVRAVGGIIQGLLDFERIDSWELSDVLEPLDAAGTYALYLQKGVLLNLVEHDRAAEVATCRARIGINPYLLLAHSVLLHNEQVLTFAALAFRHAAPASPARPTRRARIAALPGRVLRFLISRPSLTSGDPDPEERRRRQVERWLKVELLGNVFHYPTERQIFERGHAELGLAERALDLGRNLDQLANRLEGRAHDRVAGLQAYLAVLFGLVSILSALPVIDRIVASLPGLVPDPLPWLASGNPEVRAVVIGSIQAMAYAAIVIALYVLGRLMWWFFLWSTPRVDMDPAPGPSDREEGE